MTSTGQIQAAAEGTLKLGGLKADERIKLTASGDIVNGIPDQEDSVSISGGDFTPGRSNIGCEGQGTSDGDKERSA